MFIVLLVGTAGLLTLRKQKKVQSDLPAITVILKYTGAIGAPVMLCVLVLNVATDGKLHKVIKMAIIETQSQVLERTSKRLKFVESQIVELSDVLEYQGLSLSGENALNNYINECKALKLNIKTLKLKGT